MTQRNQEIQIINQEIAEMSQYSNTTKELKQQIIYGKQEIPSFVIQKNEKITGL